MESPNDAMDTNPSIIDMSKPQDLLLEECSDLLYYIDRSDDGGDIPPTFTKLLTEEANSINPSLSRNGYESRALKTTAITSEFPVTMTHQLRAGKSQIIGHCNNPIRAGQKTVITLPDDVYGSMAHEEERKRKNQDDEPLPPPSSSSSSSQMQSRKKLRLYEIETPFQDKEKERRRRNAQNSRNYRVLEKKRKSDMGKEIAEVNGSIQQLRQELERLRLRVTEYTSLLQFLQQKCLVVSL